MIQNVMMSTRSVTQEVTYLWAQAKNLWEKMLQHALSRNLVHMNDGITPVYVHASWLTETSPQVTAGTEHASRDLS